MLQPNDVYPQALKIRNGITRLDHLKHNLGILSVASATYLWASRKLRIRKDFQPNGDYAQDLKKRNRTTRLDLLILNLGCSKCRLCHLSVGIPETENMKGFSA